MRDITEVYIAPLSANKSGKLIFVAIDTSRDGMKEEREYKPTVSSACRLERLLKRFTPHRIDIVPYPALTYRIKGKVGK